MFVHISLGILIINLEVNKPVFVKSHVCNICNVELARRHVVIIKLMFFDGILLK